MRIQTLVDTNGPATSVQSISRSIGQKVCFLGRPVGSFGVSDDDQMISWRICDVDEDRRISGPCDFLKI